MRSFYFEKYNLNYIDCSDIVINVYLSIHNMGLDVGKLKDKDLKKLIFHFIVKSLLKRSRSKRKRPVYFLYKNFIQEFVDKRYVKSFLYIIDHLRKLLPVPIVLIESVKIFDSHNGDLIGLNEKIASKYINGNKSTVKLRKYLEAQEFYDLIEALSDINNIKHLST